MTRDAKEFAWYEANRETRLAQMREYGRKNRDRLNANKRRWRQDNEDHARSKQYEWKYGIKLEDYDAMLAAQNGKCAICDCPPPDEKRLYVDHDHATGAVRGLLCETCNFMLGNARDDVEVLRRAIVYLQTEWGSNDN